LDVQSEAHLAADAGKSVARERGVLASVEAHLEQQRRCWTAQPDAVAELCTPDAVRFAAQSCAAMAAEGLLAVPEAFPQPEALAEQQSLPAKLPLRAALPVLRVVVERLAHPDVVQPEVLRLLEAAGR
jgi:hypothetical protein